MAQRVLGKVLAAAVIASAIMSAGVPVMAEDNPPPPGGGKGCLVEIVDDHGNTIGYDTVPEGTVISLFHCEGGQWKFGWFPFDSLVSGGTNQVTTDEKGSLKDAVVDIDPRNGDLQVREMSSVVEEIFGERGALGKAVVATVVDRRDELTVQEYGDLLGGKDVAGVEVLAMTDPKPDDTVHDLYGAGGGGVAERRIVIRLTEDWIIVLIVKNCKKQKDGSTVCDIVSAKMQRG